MAIWAQIQDKKVTTVPADGKTSIDIYAEFVFCNNPLPDGTQIVFLVGQSAGLGNVGTVSDMLAQVKPITGLSFMESVVTISGRIAKATLLPLSGISNPFTVVAYSKYDASGKVDRLAYGSIDLTVYGGDGMFLPVVQEYDPTAAAWTIKTPMTQGR